MEEPDFLATAADWVRDYLELATRHPWLALAGGAAAVLALAVTRNLTIFIVAAFLGVAAVIGSEPVADPGQRTVFSLACLLSVLGISMVVRSLRSRLQEAQRQAQAGTTAPARSQPQ